MSSLRDADGRLWNGFQAPPGIDAFRRQWYLDGADIPDAANYPELFNNFFILPMEVLKYLYTGGVYGRNMIDYNDNVNLDAVWSSFNADVASIFPYEDFMSNSERIFQTNTFVSNEVKKLLTAPYSPDLIFSTLVNFGKTLRIPSHDVRDFPISLLIYILYIMAKEARGFGVYRMEYATGVDYANGEWHMMNGEHNLPILIKNGHIKVTTLFKVYIQLMRVFAGFFPDGEGGNRDLRITWYGNEGSGTRITMNNIMTQHFLDMTLRCQRVRSATFGGSWTQAVADILYETVGRSVISVKNEHDNKCFIYCVIIALIIKYNAGGVGVFGDDVMFVKDYEVCSKGEYLFSNPNPEITKNVHKLVKLLYPSYPEDGEDKELYDFVQNIDKETGTLQSIPDLRKKIGLIEGKLLSPVIKCGLDVYGIDYNKNSHIYPIYMSKIRESVISLLCITPQDTRCSHFCVIKNMRRLLRDSGGKQFFGCPKCGQAFYHKRLLTDHHCPAVPIPFAVPGEGGFHYSKVGVDPRIDIACGACPKCRLVFVTDFEYDYHKAHCLMAGKTGYRHVQLVSYDPAEHPVLKGERVEVDKEKRFMENARVMYADFECSIDPESGKHTFMSYGIYDCKEEFYQCGYDLHEFIEFILTKAFSSSEEHVYVFFHNAMGYDASFVLRHVMRTPEYKSWGIQVIMKSMNKLQKLVFHVKQGGQSRTLHIGDTFLFLTMSLDGIVKCVRRETLEENEEAFPRFFEIFKRAYPFVSNEEINHILRKNIFPYKFFTESSRLDVDMHEFLKIFEARRPNLEYFSDRVTIDDLMKNYQDTKHVVETFRCKSARDYHDLYLRCDVMQLADVFEQMQKVLWDSHHIHLIHYLGMPSATWAAFLRDDPELRLPLYENTFFAEFFKAMVRGGVTSAPLRHVIVKSDPERDALVPDVIHCVNVLRHGTVDKCKANLTREFFSLLIEEFGDPFQNDDIPEIIDGPSHGIPFDLPKESFMDFARHYGLPGYDVTDKYSIIYVDVNGLYPFVMQENEYPCGTFKFIAMGYTGSLCKVKLLEIFKQLEERHKGMCFCVDLHIPDDVKEKTDMYPFAPEHRRIYAEYFMDNEQHEMTPFLQKWSECNRGEKMSEFTGLVCTLYDKEKYNVHWKLLRFYMEHGVEVKKIYFAVEFDEKPYLFSYISKNIDRRNKCTTAFLKMLYKLMNNAVYGKTMEDVLRRVLMEIIRDENRLEGLIEEGNISAVLPIEDMGWIVKMNGEDVILDKPTYIGASILEFAKLHMYTLLYDKIMPIFPDSGSEKGVELVYTDTDSFILKVRHPDGIPIRNSDELFAYIKSKDPNLIGSIGGQIKSETGTDTIREVIALRSKVYAFRTLKGDYVGHAKGTTMEAQELQLDWEAYMDVLNNFVSKTTDNAVFQRIRFMISSGILTKVSLSGNDGKRYTRKDGMRTWAFGNPRIKQELEESKRSHT